MTIEIDRSTLQEVRRAIEDMGVMVEHLNATWSFEVVLLKRSKDKDSVLVERRGHALRRISVGGGGRRSRRTIEELITIIEMR